MDTQRETSIQALNNGRANQLLQTKIENLIAQTEQHQQQQQYDQRQQSADLRQKFIENIWPSVRGDYEEMTETLKKYLEACLKMHDISAVVLGRAKETNSVKKTLERRENQLFQQNKGGFRNLQEIIHEMHDLSGLRIVLDYREDYTKADSFIKKTFIAQKGPIDFDPNREIGQSWKQPWFGAFQTRNHRVSISGDTTDFSQYTGVMFEIQLTTFSEYLYNKLEHDLLYKDKTDSLTPQEEMVIDLSHGVSKCYELCMRILMDKLKGNSHKAKEHMKENSDELLKITNTLGPKQTVEVQVAMDAFVRNTSTTETVQPLLDGDCTREHRLESIMKRME
jgi:ppGpp synthetase/RelA/SpoT-type nucleotidyltranferase